MSIRVFAALFMGVFGASCLLMLAVQLSGLASAGLAAGFMVPLQDFYNVAGLLGVGLLASWLGTDAIIVMPLCGILMLAIGGMMHINDAIFHALQGFIAGAILLFALSVSILRHKMFLFSIMPVALWMYFCGAAYMQEMPPMSAPIYYLLGTVVSATLIIGIGGSLGVTLADRIHDSVEKVKIVADHFVVFVFFLKAVMRRPYQVPGADKPAS